MKFIRSYPGSYANELIIRKLRPPETQRTRFRHHEARRNIILDHVSNEMDGNSNRRFDSIVDGFSCFVAE
jgi:hypothetical protein